MATVGEAVYEITARDQKLVASLGRAEGKIRTTGKAGEGIGDNVTKGMDKSGKSAGRFGGILDKVRGKLNGTGQASKAAGGIMSGIGVAGFIGIAAAATAVVGVIGKSISAASDLAETVSKVGVVFDESGDEVLDWAKDSATAFGLSKNAALGAAATYGNLFVAMGLTSDKSADMSTSLVELAADLASFNNVDPTVALESLKSGLVGEAEPLRKFGVQLNEARIAEEALKMGLISTTKDAITPAIKTQAIYGVILADTAKAQGDFARTADGLANQQRIAAAKVEDALARLGEALVPIAAQIVPMLADAFTGLLDVFGTLIGFIQRNMKPVLLALGVILLALLPTLIGIAAAVLAATWPFLALAAVIAAFAIAYENNFFALKDITEAVFDVISGIIGFMFGLVKGIAEAFITVAEAIVGAAAAIPGPWQEAATEMQASLGEMKQAVRSFGEEALDETRETGGNIPEALGEGLAAGAPIVDGATEIMVDPIPAGVKDAKAEAVRIAKLTPGAIGSAIKAGRTDVVSAWETLKTAQKEALNPLKEIAEIEGFLTSKKLAKGLTDNRPEVRAAAQELQRVGEDRLIALRENVGGIALETGQNYADVLAEQKEKVRVAAVQALSKGKKTLRDFPADAKTYGTNTGNAYADGLEATSTRIKNAARAALNGAKGLLEADSPPKSPESPLHDIDKWGSRTMDAYAAAIAKSESVIDDAVRSALTPGRVRLEQEGGPITSARLRPPTGLGLAPVQPHNVEINVPVTIAAAGGSLPTKYDIEQIGRQLADHVRLGLVRSGIPAGTG